MPSPQKKLKRGRSARILPRSGKNFTESLSSSDVASPEFGSEAILEAQSDSVISELLIESPIESGPVCESGTSSVFPKINVATQTHYEFPPFVYELQIEQLQRDMETLKIENEVLKIHPFGFFSLKNDNKICLYYTGLHLDIFWLLENVCATVCRELPSYDGRQTAVLNFTDQFLLVMMKLRLNLDYIDLANRFGISRTSAYRIFRTILVALHVVVFQATMNEIPSRKKIRNSLPPCFKLFSNCTMVVDCTEMRCESPSMMDRQKATYSSYKKYTSMKAAIAILPNGTAIACTSCYPGSTSDRAIVQHSKIFKGLKAGDLILADKGFKVYDLLPQGVSLNIPPFLMQKRFTPSQVMRTRSIAKARIHIERFNARFKNYRITSLIPCTSFKFVSIIVQTCVGLVNYQNALLKQTLDV